MQNLVVTGDPELLENINTRAKDVSLEHHHTVTVIKREWSHMMLRNLKKKKKLSVTTGEDMTVMDIDERILNSR